MIISLIVFFIICYAATIIEMDWNFTETEFHNDFEGFFKHYPKKYKNELRQTTNRLNKYPIQTCWLA